MCHLLFHLHHHLGTIHLIITNPVILTNPFLR